MSIPDQIRAVAKRATCLYSKTDVEKALDQMAAEIHEQLSDETPIFLCVMIGALIPMGNLLTRLDFPLEVHYIHATRYRGKTHGADIEWRITPSCSLKGRTVVVVDDILDEGLTLAAILDFCKTQEAKAIYTAVLVEKEGTRLPQGTKQADFTGLKVPNRYVYGYGLDYKEYLRNAPGIYAVAAEDEHS
ncbi:MAG: Hypoxanthine-guanine phosphoribosyltransferase [Gammaproteobacteria bacterium]|jgi:hypoxanthine phosphoribosyltransferase|nr:Hypoxanthine-guanine phosphoribosyltransferase [Gammaproteobacteria bacterium]